MDKLRVVLSLITRDNDYQLEQAKAAEAVARQENIELEIFYADSNSVTELNTATGTLVRVISGSRYKISGPAWRSWALRQFI